MHRGNQLTECAHSSLLLLKDGKLIAPVLNELILPSISRKHIFEIAEELGIPTEARDVTMDEVYNADEVIILVIDFTTGKHPSVGFVKDNEYTYKAVFVKKENSWMLKEYGQG